MADVKVLELIGRRWASASWTLVRSPETKSLQPLSSGMRSKIAKVYSRLDIRSVSRSQSELYRLCMSLSHLETSMSEVQRYVIICPLMDAVRRELCGW